ncbi:hypothetical protein Nepgr_000503 [Nepenthes gracilis]|uniref:Uncharacterized protein n=1 Tax=Nepenthes gracilis TaxID=150966 RepID=A0AAD3P330_NEPGR|nr:hypothetical protein Nepgr_000503 [Nepenthes gracilis]
MLPIEAVHKQFFAVDHLSSLVNCLKESTFCQPRVHGIWHVLVNILLPDIVSQDSSVTTTLNSIMKRKKS